ncbi:MAG: gentisate 1,2-dioxygenase [Gaiellaceae bacterium]|jgi:gentisate 1,2-dioxygenase|nr:gentisate 1,2-dioxygenase [Gaiellaceae bacterium]
MSASTESTHYHVQKERRASFLDEWRRQRRTGVLSASDLAFREREPGVRIAYYAGLEEGAPTRTLDAGAHELDPGATTTPHRHSWDALLFVQEGSGWSEIGGRRIDWKPWDTIHLPAWVWHRHGNDGTKTARYLSFSSQPLLATLNLALIEEAQDGADLSERPRFAPARAGDDPFSRRLTRLAAAQAGIQNAQIHLPYDDVVLRDTPRGSRTAFLADDSIGFKTSGLTIAMFQIPPGKAQTMHRHPGEAFLYVIEGSGRSYIDAEPEGGKEYPWKPGDMINVDHFLWHQHKNDSTDAARVIRVHMFASLLETMRALADPVDLFNERPEDLAQAFDIANYEWPPENRPS